MSVYKVNVKWQKQHFADVECDTSAPPVDFKAVLFSLTGVPPQRQKVMIPGGLLKDDTWTGMRLKNGLTIMLMGNAETQSSSPTQLQQGNTAAMDVDKKNASDSIATAENEQHQSQIIANTNEEDEDEDDEAAATIAFHKRLNLPQGLQNLGNTCYMNATVQCLYSMPELRAGLSLLLQQGGATSGSMLSAGGAGVGGGALPQNLVRSLGQLFRMMQSSSGPVTPIIFMTLLHSFCPQFAPTERGGGGGASETAAMAMGGGGGGGGLVMAQQDANECWVELIRALQKILLPKPSSTPAFSSATTTTDAANQKSASSLLLLKSMLGLNEGWNFIGQFMSGRLEVSLTNQEVATASKDESAAETSTVAEESQTSHEEFHQLSCYIDKDVKYVQTGLRNGLEGTLTKFSTALQRDAVYKRSALIGRLPAYLTIQFVRFYYKEKGQINAKVLKDVKFPMQLDVVDLCTAELRSRMTAIRERFKVQDDRLAEAETLRKRKLLAGGGSAGGGSGSGVATSEEEKREAQAIADAELLAKSEPSEAEEERLEPFWTPDDPGSNNSGLYELRAVLTHQGRSSNSGHYVAWVRHSRDKWFKFDDDEVSCISDEAVLRLSGGGDWHCAYVLLYGPRRLIKPSSASAATPTQ